MACPLSPTSIDPHGAYGQARIGVAVSAGANSVWITIRTAGSIMFIGHFAPAFAAAAISPRAPRLGTLFIAGQLVDWGFFALAILGVEKMRIEPGATVRVPFDLFYMPYPHSLLGSTERGRGAGRE